MSDDEEQECRVCRCPADEDNPLRTPCLCSGSILYIHQDCLEQWLSHKGTESCELCGHTFSFTPQYAAGTPDKLPLREVLRSVVGKIFTDWNKVAFRLLLAAVAWLIVVPFTSAITYRLWLFRNGRQGGVVSFDWVHVWDDIAAGLGLNAAIILSFLFMLTFADFVRFHGDENGEFIEVDFRRVGGEPQPQPEPQPQVQPQPVPQPPVQPVAQPVPQPPVEPPVNPPELQHELQHEHQHQEQEPRPQDQEAQPQPEPEEFIDPGDPLEVNLALPEILGIEGSVWVLVHNVGWLCGFDAVFIGLFAFIPISVGRSIIAACSPWISFSSQTLSNWLAPSVITAIEAYLERRQTSEDEGHLFQADHLIALGVGYSVIVMVLQVWCEAARPVRAIVRRQTLISLLWTLECFGNMTKVGTMLACKMLVVPTFMGCLIDLATLCLFAATLEERATFAADSLMLFILAHWVVGLTFMVVVTLHALPLRELLHPDILSRLVRPQEAHAQVIHALVKEPTLTQFHKLICTCAIYIVVLIVLIAIPSAALAYCVPSMVPIQLGADLSFPSIQLPFFLLSFHIFTLYVQDYSREPLGHVQYFLLTYACERLGLTEWLLPRLPLEPPQTVSTPAAEMQRELAAMLDSEHNEQATTTTATTTDDDNSQGTQADLGETKASDSSSETPRFFDAIECPEVAISQEYFDFVFLDNDGQEAPCTAFDREEGIGFYTYVCCMCPQCAPVAHQHKVIPYPVLKDNKWSWEASESTELEASLSPRSKPASWPRLRVLGLYAVGWVVGMVSLAVVVVPFALGVQIWDAARIAPEKRHGPLAYAVGCLLIYFALVAGRRLSQIRIHQQLSLRTGVVLFASLWVLPCVTGTIVITLLTGHWGLLVDSNGSPMTPTATLFSVYHWLVGTSLLAVWAFVLLHEKPDAGAWAHRFHELAEHAGAGHEWIGRLQDIVYNLGPIMLPSWWLCFVNSWVGESLHVYLSTSFAVSVIALVGVLIAEIVAVPVHGIYKKAHDSIRDDMYLVGRVLEDR